MGHRGDPDFAAQIGWDDTPPPFGEQFAQVWSLGRSGSRLYAGTKPATLLASDDDGESWEIVKGLTDHPSAAEWNPGAAGLTLHTILGDPGDDERLWVGISAAGVFTSTDGGVTWERSNALADPAGTPSVTTPAGRAMGRPACACTTSRAPRTGGSINRITSARGAVMTPAPPGDITAGLPSTFAFPIRASTRATRRWSGPFR